MHSFGLCHLQKDIVELEKVQRGLTGMVKGVIWLSYKGRSDVVSQLSCSYVYHLYMYQFVVFQVFQVSEKRTCNRIV